MEELELEIEEYKESLKILDKLYPLSKYKDIVENQKDTNIDFEEMNKWILELNNLYKEYNIDIQNEILNNDVLYTLEGHKITINSKAKKYMQVFYKHLDDLSNKEFIDIIMEVCKKESIEYDNHIFDDIRNLFKTIYSTHKKLFEEDFNLLNNKLSKYHFQNITINNINETRNHLIKQIKQKEKELKEQEEKKKIEDEKRIAIEKKEQEIRKYETSKKELCNILTNGKYDKMNEEEKSSFDLDLPKILEIIIKYNLFDRFSNFYKHYEEKSNKEEIIKLNETTKILDNKVLQLIQKEEEIIDKKINLFYLKTKKAKELKENEEMFNNINIAITKNNEKLEKMKQEYLEGFYKSIDPDGKGILHILSEQYNIDLELDSNKLFGVFSIESLPITTDKINNIDIFKKYEITIPEPQNNDFITLCHKCIDLLKYKQIQELREKSKYKEKISDPNLILDTVFKKK